MTSARFGRLAGFAILASLASAGVQAQTLSGTSGASASSQLDISGVAPSGCVISTPNTGATSNASLSAGPGAAEVTVLQLVDPNSAVPLPANITLQFPVICNGAHVLTITARDGALVLQQSAPPPGPGFRNSLVYQIQADWVGQSVSASSADAPLQINSANAATGDLNVNIQIPGGGEPLEAGTYTDQLIVNLHPAS